MKKTWRFFLDQNIRIEVRTALQQQEIDCIHATDVHMAKATDPEILQYAIETRRVLVTRDTDFGNFSVLPLPRHHPGVIRLNIDPPLAPVLTEALLAFCDRHAPPAIENALAIITKNKVRIRRSPDID